MDKKLYAVVFDNDEMYPGVLQFCNVGNDEEHLQCAGTNLTHDKVHAVAVVKECKKYWPDYNYRVVEMIIKP